MSKYSKSVIVPAAFILGGAAAAAAALSLMKKRSAKEPAVDEYTGAGGGFGPGAVPNPSLPLPDLVTGPPALMRYGQEDLSYFLEERGLDEEWATFFEAVAAGESGFNNLAGRGDPNGAVPDLAEINEDSRESAAAEVAFERNEYLASCPWPAAAYTFGSGGWFAQIPANALRAYKGTELECLHPWYVFDPLFSIDMAVAQAKRLMRWSAFQESPHWITLRTGWGSPSSMDDEDALLRMAEGKYKFGDRLVEIGADPDLMFEEVTDLL